MKIGFIGLGSLGAPTAQNLLDIGHELVVFNRTTSKTLPLIQKGAVAAASIEELAKECNIVCSLISDDAALFSISEDLLKHLQQGSIHISISTILPQTAKELAEVHEKNGLHYLAAPVFGRPEAAKARKLNFAISGPEKLRRQAEPILKDAGGVGVWDFGESITAANTVKLCGNFLIGSALEAIGESVALAKQSGIDPIQMWNMFSQTFLNNPLYQNYSQIILQQKFEPAAFSMKLGLKDINLVLQQAESAHLNMPLAELLQQHMMQMVGEGKSHVDWSAVSQAGN
jgi:3-hydroxyisobutyrate dehydrogenase-like beta-hydroxyacid dehydrogenase